MFVALSGIAGEGVLGLQLGARLAERLPSAWMQRVFSVVVLCMALSMIFENFGTH